MNMREPQDAQRAIDEMFEQLMTKCSRVAYCDQQLPESVEMRYLPAAPPIDFNTSAMRIVGPVLHMQINPPPFRSSVEALAYVRGQVDAYWIELLNRGPCHAYVRARPKIEAQQSFASDTLDWRVHARVSFFADDVSVKVVIKDDSK